MYSIPASKILKNGFTGYLVPIIPPGAKLHPSSKIKFEDLGKIPGVYDPLTGTWKGISWQDLKASEDEILDWTENWPGVGLGLRTGEIIGIDIDITDQNLAKEIEAHFAIHLGDAPCRIGNFPKRLLLYRLDGEPRKKVIARIQGCKAGLIEILGDGNQFVAYGIHSKTMKPYTWQNGGPDQNPFEAIPTVTHSEIDHALNSISKVLSRHGCSVSLPSKRAKASKRGDISSDLLDQPETILKAKSYLLNHAPLAIENSGGNNTTFYVGCVLANMGISESTAFELMLELWNDTKADPPWEEGDLEQLVANAYKHNSDGIGSKHISKVFEAREDIPNSLPEYRRLQPLSVPQLAALPRRKSLIKGVLDQGSMSVAFGESNSGKTFFALDIALHICTGTPWLGKKTEKGKVIYIAAEGGRSIEDRIQAFLIHHGYEEPDLLFILPTNVDLSANSKDTAEFINEIKTLGQVELIVVDTLSRAMSGGNENNSDDMGSLIKNLDAIRAATGAHLMAIHHSGKDANRGARGHSSLRAAVDTEIEVKKDGQNIVSANIRKQRDGITGQSFTFELRPIFVRKDEEDEWLTSCILIPVAAVVKKKALSPQLSSAYSLLCNLIQVADGERISLLRFKSEIKIGEICKTTDEETLRRRTNQIVKDLVDRKYIVVEDEEVSLKINGIGD